MKIERVRDWPGLEIQADSSARATEEVVRSVIEAVRNRGDSAVREYAARFDRANPARLEVSMEKAREALAALKKGDRALVEALELSAKHLETFARAQKAPFTDFSLELAPGLIASQRTVPVERAAVYVPAGRFPLFSSVLMGVIPARVAGCREVVLASPPQEDGLPDPRILAAAVIAGVDRIFAVGGSQAIAALAFGTESIPRADVIVGPGNKYVATAKKLLYGQVGIDFIAGPTDVLVLADKSAKADLVAADLLAQAEHDPDARARALVPSEEFARAIVDAVDLRLARLEDPSVAQASLAAGGLILVYENRREAIDCANAIAPEHLELHLEDPAPWKEELYNYGSLFVGEGSVEALGDYCAGVNHTLPTSGTARFTGGLSVRHFLKTLTGLETAPAAGLTEALAASAIIGRAEGLECHALSADARLKKE